MAKTFVGDLEFRTPQQGKKLAELSGGLRTYFSVQGSENMGGAFDLSLVSFSFEFYRPCKIFSLLYKARCNVTGIGAGFRMLMGDVSLNGMSGESPKFVQSLTGITFDNTQNTVFYFSPEQNQVFIDTVENGVVTVNMTARATAGAIFAAGDIVEQFLTIGYEHI